MLTSEAPGEHEIDAPKRVPFHRPTGIGSELDLIRQAISLGELAGGGSITRRVERLLEQTLGVRRALLTTSCTHALEMCALLLDIKRGDEVILPSFTFTSTANAFVLHGAKPVFVDIRPDTLNIDEAKIESAITERTRAIVVVHYAGIACEMTAILETANRHGLPVIEDNAHGLFGKFRGAFLGTLGSIATQSFHATKNFTCGEGGALLLNDMRFLERAEIIREKGTDRSRFIRGEVDKYSWCDVGSSFVISGMLAAFLLGQLEAREDIQDHRRRIFEYYEAELSEWAALHKVSVPTVPEYAAPAYHLYYLLLPSAGARDRFLEHMHFRGIGATFHYMPLHTSPMGQRWNYRRGDFPVTESVAERLVRLPLYSDLSEEEMLRVVSCVRSFQAWE